MRKLIEPLTTVPQFKNYHHLTKMHTFCEHSQNLFFTKSYPDLSFDSLFVRLFDCKTAK